MCPSVRAVHASCGIESASLRNCSSLARNASSARRRSVTSIASGEPFDMIFPLKGADGRFRPFLTRVMPVRGEDGEVAHWFGTNTDISEIK